MQPGSPAHPAAGASGVVGETEGSPLPAPAAGNLAGDANPYAAAAGAANPEAVAGAPDPSTTAAAAAANPNAGAASAAAVPAYLAGAVPAGLAAAFQRQSDVCFLAADGAELLAHSQFLARSCTLFSDLLDSGGCVDGCGNDEAALVREPPAPAVPLRVPVQCHSSSGVEHALVAVYQPHLMPRLVASLHTAADYGAQLDLAAFLG